MRHKKSFNHLGRTASHRRAMLSNMAVSLIMHKRITTTLAKAKALRSYVEPIITKSKEDTTHSRRVVFSYLQDKYAVTELFREISRKVGDRPGGYTRIIKLGTRQGDNAEMALIELVDYNEHLLAEKAAKKSKSTRRRRGGKKKTAEAAPAAAPAETVAEEKAADAVKETKEQPKAEKEVKVEDKKAETSGKTEEAKEEKAPQTEAKKEKEHQEKPEKEEKEEKKDKKEGEEGKEYNFSDDKRKGCRLRCPFSFCARCKRFFRSIWPVRRFRRRIIEKKRNKKDNSRRMCYLCKTLII